MVNPLFDRRHIREYIIFGALAAIGYLIPLIVFLQKNNYQAMYYLFMGVAIFMVPIFFYCYKLLYTRYDEKRAVSMLFAGHLATLTGIIIAAVSTFILMWIYYPHMFGSAPVEAELPNVAPQVQLHTQGHLLLMVLITATIGNFATGSFISIVVSYAGKRDQTGDRPVQVGPREPGNQKTKTT